jgi:hypothetical protein
MKMLLSMLHVMGGGRASSLCQHPVRVSRIIWIYREPSVPDIPCGAISGIPGLPGDQKSVHVLVTRLGQGMKQMQLKIKESFICAGSKYLCSNDVDYVHIQYFTEYDNMIDVGTLFG